jgi:hypothetical protein
MIFQTAAKTLPHMGQTEAKEKPEAQSASGWSVKVLNDSGQDVP